MGIGYIFFSFQKQTSSVTIELLFFPYPQIVADFHDYHTFGWTDASINSLRSRELIFRYLPFKTMDYER